MSSGMWHERSYRNPQSDADERWRPRVHAFFNGKNYVGDHDNGNIYEVSTTTYTDNGDIIIRERVSPVVWNALERIYYKSIEFDVESGVGLTTGQGVNPLMVYSHSNDSGHTFGNESFLSVGAKGKYRV